MPQVFGSDEILWYSPPGTVWGELGYACPNFGANPTTLNSTIASIVSMMGGNLFAIMHHSDADSRTPPTINTLIRIHKLVVRARTILSGRALPPAALRMEPTHTTPSPESFLLFPCPYFKVRNGYLKEWAGLLLNALGECCQHTENRIEYEISTSFAGLISQYLQRIYVRMASELFLVPIADAQKPDFTLSDAQLAAFDPTKFFTSTELVDTVPPLDMIPTENDLTILRAGIPATMVLGLQRYPTGGNPLQFLNPTVAPSSAGGGASGGNATATAGTGSFIPPPGP